jgi:hypothetical protein
MAGIGEATAIIAVAQIGIQASKTIFEFVGEVKEAPKEIRRIGRDICTTSERLEEIGRLIDNNHTSRFFNQGGIASAVRCSNDCKEIITQVNGVLAKGGWIADAAALEKKDFDISLLDALRWPFLRTKLASPQADLEKVKASLSLLFNSVMATA